MIPPLSEVHRFRPVRLVQDERTTQFRAPFVAVEGLPEPDADAVLELRSGRTRLLCRYDATRRRLHLEVVDPSGRRSRHISRRHGRVSTAPEAIALTLTGRWLTAWSRTTSADAWVTRARVHVTDHVEVRDPAFLATLEVATPSGLSTWRSGTFGQVGIRDVHVVTHADGSAYTRGGRHYVTATHAGPGFADAAQTGVWSWLPGTEDLRHEASLWWLRDGLVQGDHAAHLVRDGDRWLALTSTWGDFDRTRMAITLTTTEADLVVGEHVLTGDELDLPRPRGRQVGVWDPHLVQIEESWYLAWVSARRYFDFRPVLGRAATPHGPWQLIGSADDRTATEGCVIVRTEEGWRVLASDGADNPRGHRLRYPAFDLSMQEVGALAAPFTSNIPWPSVVAHDGQWSMITFDGTPYGGALPGYGTHGDVLVLRHSSADAASSSARTSD
jgi:hypothetical protein